LRDALTYEEDDDTNSVDMSNIANRDESSESELDSFDEWKGIGQKSSSRPTIIENVKDALQNAMEELDENRDETRIAGLHKVSIACSDSIP